MRPLSICGLFVFLVSGCALGGIQDEPLAANRRTPNYSAFMADAGLADAEPTSPDAMPDAIADAMPAACIPVAETCNGLDDDCDTIIDEEARDCGAGCERLGRMGRSYIVCSTERSWPGAQRSCASLGYTLASIEDADEDRWLYDLIDARGFGGTWHGHNDLVTEGRWVWDDGAPLTYENWDTDEPNDAGGEDCGIIMTTPHRAGRWDDRACDSERPYVCEQP